METILLVDDNHEFRALICNYLLDAGYDVWDVACPDEAYKLLKREKFDLMVCDLHMPFTLNEEMEEFQYSSEVGIKTIGELAWVFPKMPIIAISAMTPFDAVNVRNALGPVPFLQKPFHQTELIGLVKDLLHISASDSLH